MDDPDSLLALSNPAHSVLSDGIEDRTSFREQLLFLSAFNCAFFVGHAEPWKENSLLYLPVLLQEGMLGTEHRQCMEWKEVGPPSFKVRQQTAAIFRDNIQEGVFEEKDLPLDVTEEILSPAPDYGNWN